MDPDGDSGGFSDAAEEGAVLLLGIDPMLDKLPMLSEGMCWDSGGGGGGGEGAAVLFVVFPDTGGLGDR